MTRAIASVNYQTCSLYQCVLRELGHTETSFIQSRGWWIPFQVQMQHNPVGRQLWPTVIANAVLLLTQNSFLLQVVATLSIYRWSTQNNLYSRLLTANRKQDKIQIFFLTVFNFSCDFRTDYSDAACNVKTMLKIASTRLHPRSRLTNSKGSWKIASFSAEINTSVCCPL